VLLEVFFRVSWIDDRLILPERLTDPNSTSSSMPMHLSALQSIWVPDPYIERTRDIHKLRIMQDFAGLWISKDKSIFLSTMLQIRLGCTMNFALFPFDVQKCIFLVSSYIYQENDVKFGWLRGRISVDREVKHLLANYEFSLRVSNETLCECYKCIPPQLPCVKASLVFARKYYVYILTTYLPSFLFVAVGYASFFWPPEIIPGRTVLAITALLTIVSMYAAI
ncbi:unnamed protein product, partial [Meganyctiphanes norvegica]